MNRNRGWRHSAETRAKIAAKNKQRWADPEARAKASADTRARMADPAVRQRIRDGMVAAAGLADALAPLRRAWRDAPPDVRKHFLDEILSPVCTASAPNGAGER
ncbi:hypothetical protein KQX64_03355 [Rhodopseudomonas palustris]|nr:hypothetical protein KQX64_03355 [Rhodopseudomonas palustris]